MKRAKNHPLKTEKVLTGAILTAAAKRFMVANYYQSQAMRKRMDMQMRHFGDRVESIDAETHRILDYTQLNFAEIEGQVAKTFAKLLVTPVDKWLIAQRGIGPVLAVGLTAHLDITKAPTAGHFWSFAGLNPNMKWEKGEKRPYNAELKQLCWHAGQCFMKQSNDPDCFYGRLYRGRKQFEIKRNESGANAERAKTFKVSPGATKEVKAKLAEGKLPDFNIDARARRYAVKIFLSHLHAVMFWNEYGNKAPLPYSIAMLNHAHFIDIPHAEMFPGFSDALRKAA